MVAQLNRRLQAYVNVTGKQLVSGILILLNVLVLIFVSFVAFRSPANAYTTGLRLPIEETGSTAFPGTELAEKIHDLGRTQFIRGVASSRGSPGSSARREAK
jgi:hypothetical protein